LYLLYGISVCTVTPNFRIVATVASRYGFDTKFPSIVRLIPFSVSGAQINSAEINWLEKFPGIFTSPPTIFPLILIGGFPSVELHCAPMLDNASKSGCIGLFCKLESPVRVISSGYKLAIPDAILIVVPEFSVLISGTFVPNFIGFLTIICESVVLLSSPNFLQASIVAFVSAENKAFSTLLLFPARDARKIALCL